MRKWFYPKLGGGEVKGLNDSGIQSFKSRDSLGRETCQNIVDVRNGTGDPAIATVELVDLPTGELPNKDEFQENFLACRDFVLEGFERNSDQKNVGGTGNEASFFEQGLALLDATSIPTLKISDRNTSGLVGSDDDRTKSFCRLIKMQGASSLQGDGGGTYGIGQRAPYAHSGLRTVLYSTKTNEGYAFIGKSILATFRHPIYGELTQPTAWYCNVNDDQNWSTIRDKGDIPNLFVREEIGTDLWVVGYTAEDWEINIRHSVLQHFFASIENEQLVLELKRSESDIKVINSDNLKEELVIAAEESKERLSMREYRSGLGATLYFHQALVDPLNGKPFKTEIERLGECKFFLTRDLENPDMPNRWARLRRPRIIVDHIESGLLNRFAGVFICETKEGNEYLAELEDPQHIRWHQDEARHWTEAQRRKGKNVISEISKFVRETLKAVRGADSELDQDIPDLGRYLPADDDSPREEIGGAIPVETDQHTEIETGVRKSADTDKQVLVFKPVRTSSTTTTSRDVSVVEAEDEDGEFTSVTVYGTGEIDDLDNPRVIEEGTGKFTEDGENGQTKKVISPGSVTARFFKDDDAYKLVLKAKRDQEGELHIVAVGEDRAYPIKLRSACDVASDEQLRVSGSKIQNLKIPKNQKIELSIKLIEQGEFCLSLGV